MPGIRHLQDFTPLAFNDRTATDQMSSTYLVNVRTFFGARGDGVSNDTTALQAAFNSKFSLYFPPGQYLYSTTLTLPVLDETNSCIYVGAGMTDSRLIYTGLSHGIQGPNGRTDHFVFQDISIESNNAANNGDGFHFVGNNDVQTRIQLSRTRVQGFFGWGYYSYNTQTSQIISCHFRDNTKGHIAFEDDNIGEFSREPNANQIIYCLLDNSFADAGNVAAIRLFNSNGTLVMGNTIQGHWIGGGNDPCIWIDTCRGVHLDTNHIEAGSAVTAAGILVEDSFGTTIQAGTGSGLHTKDVELVNCRSTFLIGCSFINDVANVTLDSNCRETLAIGCRFLAPTNIAQNDSSPDGMRVIGCSYHNQTSSATMQIDRWVGAREHATYDHLENGDFSNNLTYWLGSLTGISRVSTGSPPDNGPYVLCNTQALGDGGQVGSNNFHQTYDVPDNIPGGSAYTLVVQFYIEDDGASSTGTRFVDLEYTGSGFSGSTIFRIVNTDVDNGKYTIGRWYQAKITDVLNSTTGRTIKVNINPTQGANTPRIRFSKFHLYQGTEVTSDGCVALLNKINSFWMDQYIDVGGSTTGAPRNFGMGHKDGSGLQTGEAARFFIGDAFNSIQCSNSGDKVIQAFHGLRFYGRTFGGDTGSEQPIGFFTAVNSDPHHWFISSNGGFSTNVSDNPNIQTQSASNSTSAYKHIRGVNSGGSERFCINENGSYTIQGNQIITTRQAAVADAVGGATVDAEARTAINALLARLRTHGLIA